MASCEWHCRLFVMFITWIIINLLCAAESTTTVSPTCQDYANYNSTHGIDKTSPPKIMQFPTNNHLPNIGTFYRKQITCNHTTNDVCIITCDTTRFCALATIEPDLDITLQELTLVCSARKSCQHLQLNIEHTAINNINILCGPALSCDELSITINNIHTTFLSLQCGSSHSCNDISINFMSQNINTNVSCYDAYACDNMYINTASSNSKNVFIQLNMYKYSENVLINHPYSNNIETHCGSQNEDLYIEYPINDVLHESELFKLAKHKYDSRNLPCSDITIDCSHNETYFDYQKQECHYEYELLPINISTYSDITECLWIEINDLIEPNCIGTCDDNIMFYNNYNITFELDIIIHFDEEMSREDHYGKWASDSLGSSDEIYFSNTQSYEACQKYFGTANTTQISLIEIDNTFNSVLKIIQKDHKALIHSILIPPQTMLNYDYNIGFVKCRNEKRNIIKIITDVSIESMEDNSEKINEIFNENSQFIATAKKLFETMFNAPIILNVHHSEINDGVGKKWIFAVIFFGLLCIGIILGAIYRKRKQYLRRRELKTIYISNAKVICIGIGFYDEYPKKPEINGQLTDLDGVRIDINNVIKLFVETLNYDLFPNYLNDNVNTYKSEWTYNEIIDFLKQEADNLENNLIECDDPYDALVVIISCHGANDNIITSDYKLISKTSIHRIFSSKKPKIRQIPRVFVFDCCSGSNEREDDFRLDNINDKGKGKSILNDNDEKGNDDEMRSILNQHNEEDTSVIWARDEDNPDYKLVKIHAANEGFQSKMDCESGSYVITAFTNKTIDNIMVWNNSRNLRKIFDGIQEELHQKGKQLMENVYNNKTGNIKFVVKGNDQDLRSVSIIHRLGNVFSDDERRGLIQH